eukprot:TRINITY_DN297_c0_g1_i6.p1 TRINITY_DN297_c0_g1~~TRINITY_DN297_c0_g1_i6.p1  ORF type:complete len:362 (+),score=52.21 TRINITY_DN297_c0_g1_i6:117-1202(+)
MNLNCFLVLLLLIAVSSGQGTRSTSSGRRSSVTDSQGQEVGGEIQTVAWANPLPKDENKIERVLKGEDGNDCRNTKAIAEVSSANEVRSMESIEKAVAEAVVNNYQSGNPVDAAEKSATAVLDVLVQAVGSVKATIQSSAQGCWGIAFGRATARAFAEGTVTAIGEALSTAVGPDASVEFEAATQESATNVSEVVESVAALLGAGDGKTSSMYRQVKVEAKVHVMACALARAYAAVSEGEARGAALASTGCQEANKVTPKSPPGVACQCKGWSSQGEARGCGQHGVNGANDTICYVRDPAFCDCAQQSKFYSNQAWRYCGQSLGEMQVYLNTQDNKNGIDITPSAHGYCGSFDSRFDKKID